MEEYGVFAGFEDPTENWSKLPHALIGAFPGIVTVSELKIILYVLRHTWGFGEYDDAGKRITLDEFANGRKRRDGSRLDGGTGLTPNAIKAGIKRAIRHGFLVQEGDGRDAARSSHKYHLRMVSDFDTLPSNSDTQPSEIDSLPSNSDTRSEKDTLETYPKGETPATDPIGDVDSVIQSPDFQAMLSDLREHLEIVTNPRLTAELARHFREDPRRLRGLYEHALANAGKYKTPAGKFISDVRGGVQLDALPASILKKLKAPEQWHYRDRDDTWKPVSDRPLSWWGRR